jgi:transketolase
MGDLITNEVSGELLYVPEEEFQRINNLEISDIRKAYLFSNLCRINSLYMIARAGSGHIGSSFSSMDIFTWLYLYEMKGEVNSRVGKDNDFFFSSKGHDAPAIYSILLGLGKLDFHLLHKLRRIDGLPGHPDISTPNILTNTGSLGMGISKAKGIIFANRKVNKGGRVFVVTGDGELQEGQIWESLISAVNSKLDELIVIVDHNKLQSDTLLSKVNDLGNLEDKFLAFGWHVSRCDGNNLLEFSKELDDLKNIKGRPKVIIADTIKGKGVSFMEHTSSDSDVELYQFHSGAPVYNVYLDALDELTYSINQDLLQDNYEPLALSKIIKAEDVAKSNTNSRLIPAYTKALLEQARKNKDLIALDADLVRDTGLIPFKEEFPERFIECGIAEQDMVSQAGGIALMGLIPIVHSFSCFLTSRPNEQIYNNSTELTKIIYIGSLAGVIPGGPGHSHQAVRDISSLSAIPHLDILEPSCEEEVKLIFDWCVDKGSKSYYIRLISVPFIKNFSLRKEYKITRGIGTTIREGIDGLIIAYGPILLSNAIEAAKIISDKYNLEVKILNLPWLNYIDEKWFLKEIRPYSLIISLDNHFRHGGQGDRIADILSKNVLDARLLRFFIEDKPACGTNEEVLNFHNLDPISLSNKIYAYINEMK